MESSVKTLEPYKDKSKIIKTTEETLVNNDTGEVIIERHSKTSFVPKEPDFVKLYLSHISYLHGVPAGVKDIFYILLLKMNYDNEIHVYKEFKERIANELNISIGYIEKTLKSLLEKDILKKKARSLYLVNPNIIARGSWNNIEKLRLTVEYSKKGVEYTNESVSKFTAVEVGMSGINLDNARVIQGYSSEENNNQNN